MKFVAILNGRWHVVSDEIVARAAKGGGRVNEISEFPEDGIKFSPRVERALDGASQVQFELLCEALQKVVLDMMDLTRTGRTNLSPDSECALSAFVKGSHYAVLSMKHNGLTLSMGRRPYYGFVVLDVVFAPILH